MNIRKWQGQKNYSGEDLSEYYIIYTKHRDSKPAEEANFETIWNRLKDYDGTRMDKFNHWAVGWIKQILVHEEREKALEEAKEIERELEEYLVLDEELFAKKEKEV